MSEYVIFSIDDLSIHGQAKFLRHLDTLRAMSKLVGPPRACIGFYDNAMEPSWLLHLEDYLLHVKDKGYADGQESVLRLSGMNMSLHYADGKVEDIGLVSCSQRMPPAPGWTYFLDSKTYMTNWEPE